MLGNKNKILVRVQPPFSPCSAFSLHQLTLSQSHSHPFPFPLSCKLHSLCWKLSRKWRLACFSDSFDIYIVHHKSQSDSAAQVVKKIKEALPVTDVFVGDGEVISGSLISKAVDCSLRSLLLEKNWKCVGDGYIVNSSFSRGEEKSHVYALDVTIQVDTDDCFVALVSPDVVRFSRHKIMDLLGSERQQRFNIGEEVFVDNYGFVTSCLVLPSLHEGHVIGLSRCLPAVENLEHMEELWTSKVFLNSVSVTTLSCTSRFPSAFVLQGSGLNPVPQTNRASNAILALESFMAAIEAWDFFDGGLLKFKDVCRLGISSDLPSWTKALNNNEEHFLTAVNNPCMQKSIEGKVHSLGSLLSALDFRIPKPASGVLFGRETSEHTQIKGSTISSNKDTPNETCSHFKDVGPVRTSAKLRPLFMERKRATISTNSGKLDTWENFGSSHLIPSSAKSSYVSDTTCQQSVIRSNTADLQKDKSFQSREPIPKGIAGKETYVSPEALTKDLNTKKNAAIQEDEVCLEISSKTLKQKEVTKKLHNRLKDTKKVITAKAETEMFSNKQEKISL
ncbi:putative DNA binding protein [Cinnamomum micranthum f. kanehirae]|uniref:Putative DNA binding protein n=1 Tax=Cinnamomum micranthum f. kanehirae TaxID=337451 RepID=A0A3S3MNX9_9MAGN|nr:putative DNA binding protein [Cinnamomum micranthum f. kanehirae]